MKLLILLALTFLHAAHSQAAPTNSVIDLSIPAPQEPLTDSAVFDESVVFSPNFAINQNDPQLSDLFDSNGKSNLCFPTSLAETLIYLYGYHTPPLSSLLLSGLSTDQKSIDPNILVHQLSSICKTSPSNGTFGIDGLKCALSILSQSGYSAGKTTLISPFNQDSTLPIQTRPVTIGDIREAIKSGDPVLLEAAWFSFDPKTKQWTRANGHYISVFGYDYNNSWGENQIQLKIINPETNYGSSRQNALWDTVTLVRVSPQPGISYPSNRPFILTGSGFGGASKRGFLGMMLRVSPSTPSGLTQ